MILRCSHPLLVSESAKQQLVRTKTSVPIADYNIFYCKTLHLFRLGSYLRAPLVIKMITEEKTQLKQHLQEAGLIDPLNSFSKVI